MKFFAAAIALTSLLATVMASPVAAPDANPVPDSDATGCVVTPVALLQNCHSPYTGNKFSE
ncbi:MAG: hypothetical protein Q9159_002923 [Coniocarpon cinnabarinum]